MIRGKMASWLWDDQLHHIYTWTFSYRVTCHALYALTVVDISNFFWKMKGKVEAQHGVTANQKSGNRWHSDEDGQWKEPCGMTISQLLEPNKWGVHCPTLAEIIFSCQQQQCNWMSPFQTMILKHCLVCLHWRKLCCMGFNSHRLKYTVF